jgi:hypothetical protein
MKRETMVKLWKVIGSLEGLKHDVRFSYFLAKNKVALRAELDIMDEAQKPSEAYLEFENRRVELAQKFSDKDANGQPKVHNGQYVIYDNRDEFEKEMKKLKTKFKSAIESREKQIDEYAALLKEPVELSLSKIKFTQLPPQIESAYLEVFLEAGVIDDDSGE